MRFSSSCCQADVDMTIWLSSLPPRTGCPALEALGVRKAAAGRSEPIGHALNSGLPVLLPLGRRVAQGFKKRVAQGLAVVEAAPGFSPRSALAQALQPS